MKKFFIYDTFLKEYILFIHSCSEKKMLEFIKKEYNVDLKENKSNGSHIALFNKDNQFSIIWVKEEPDSPYFWPIVIHELTHHCFYIMDSRNIQIKLENDEVFAYYMEMIFHDIYLRINKKKEKA